MNKCCHVLSTYCVLGTGKSSTNNSFSLDSSPGSSHCVPFYRWGYSSERLKLPERPPVVTEAGVGKPSSGRWTQFPRLPERAFLVWEEGSQRGWLVPPWENKSWVRHRTTTSSEWELGPSQPVEEAPPAEARPAQAWHSRPLAASLSLVLCSPPGESAELCSEMQRPLTLCLCTMGAGEAGSLGPPGRKKGGGCSFGPHWSLRRALGVLFLFVALGRSLHPFSVKRRRGGLA